MHSTSVLPKVIIYFYFWLFHYRILIVSKQISTSAMYVKRLRTKFQIYESTDRSDKDILVAINILLLPSTSNYNISLRRMMACRMQSFRQIHVQTFAGRRTV